MNGPRSHGAAEIDKLSRSQTGDRLGRSRVRRLEQERSVPP